MKFRPSFDVTPLWAHVFCVAFFATVAVMENSFVIWIFVKRTQAKSAGNVYIITLAMLDICSVLFVLPQYPFMHYYVTDPDRFIWKDICLAILEIIMLSYLSILVFMAVERARAVFRPLNFNPSIRKNIITCASSVATITVAMFVFKFTGGAYNDVITQSSMMLTMFFTFLMLVTIYPAIALKLARQRKIGVASQGLQTTHFVQTTKTNIGTEVEQPAPPSESQGQHVSTVSEKADR